MSARGSAFRIASHRPPTRNSTTRSGTPHASPEFFVPARPGAIGRGTGLRPATWSSAARQRSMRAEVIAGAGDVGRGPAFAARAGPGVDPRETCRTRGDTVAGEIRGEGAR